MRRVLPLLACVFLASAPASGQTAASQWTFSATVATYAVPDQPNYVQPTITADRDWFHMEARYNYEELRTGSLWVGNNFGGEGKVAWELTAMLGGVFGEFTGVAPGYKAALSWGKLDFYSEGEQVIDTAEPSDSFFYNWSEAAISPAGWLRLGLVTQRTRAYDSDRDIQRGFLAGVTYGRLEATTYVFNPDDEPTIVVSVGWALELD